MLNNEKINHLLFNVHSVLDCYNKIIFSSGERFNIFKVLRLESSETGLHSRFIGELLNPKGSHGLNDTFLKLFVSNLGINNFKTDKASIKIEHYIGPKNQEILTGGRIDILISSEDRHIIIENKIYASDQYRQLERYRKSFNKPDLVYLTLYGSKPSLYSTGSSTEAIKNLKTISYRDEILKWLVECKEKSVQYPLLRETISQYIHLIKYLTGQSINQDMEKEVVKIIIDNLEEAFAISGSINAAKKELIQIFKQQVKIKSEEHELVPPEFDDNLCFSKDSSFHFPIQNSLKYRLHFYFINSSRFIYGILNDDLKYSVSLKNSLANTIGRGLEGWQNWAWVSDFDNGYNNWELEKPWLAIRNGVMADLIIEKVKRTFDALANVNWDE